MSFNNWEKLDPNGSIYWLVTDETGTYIFTFDKVKTFNLWFDYPDKLTDEEREIFDKETGGFWRRFFGLDE